ncbi:MAG: putative transporter substrate binding lipoprotein [Frankiales bacterium]|nr:putative transporter substrate binding lipoprotein [Frankiales bacterium]
MPRPARTSVLAALALTALALTSACSSSPGTTRTVSADGPDLSRVVLKVGDQVKLNQSVLEAAGELDDLPYRLEWASFTAGPPLLEALNAHAIDLGGTGDSPAAFAQASGAKLKVVAVQKGPGTDKVLVTKGSGITDVAGLRGKKVAVAKGSSAHGTLVGLLEKAHLSLSDITPVYLAPPDALSAFGSGKVDAWVVWNPYAAIGLTQAGGRQVADGTGISSGQSFVLASDRTLADPGKTAAARDYVSRLARANAWANDHPEVWVPKYASLTGLPTSVAQTTFESSKGTYVPLDDDVAARQQALIERFRGAGLIKGSPKAADFFDDRFDADVLAAQPSPAVTG